MTNVYVCVSSHFKFRTAIAYRYHCCAMVVFFLLSPHPADPTITTENLMEVVRGVESRWEDLGNKLFVRRSERQNIQRLYQSDHQKMEAIINHYVRHYPTSSWSEVASALEMMNLRQLAKVVTTKYVRGMWLGVPLASGGYILMCIFRISSFAFSFSRVTCTITKILEQN